MIPLPFGSPQEWTDAALPSWPKGLSVPRLDGGDWRGWVDNLVAIAGDRVLVPDQSGFGTFIGWAEALLDANQGVL